MTRKAKTIPPQESAPDVRQPLKILPITAEQIRDPQLFNNWIFSMGPLILQELFNNLPAAGANERVRTLATLYQTTLQYRPFIPQNPSPTGDDPAALLAQLLASPMEIERE